MQRIYFTIYLFIELTKYLEALSYYWERAVVSVRKPRIGVL